jgi:glutamyl-tRNA synthetase
MSDSVRVRFAPSPTGMLHIGGLRTALYNYLFARRSSGTFVLRVEDTDRERFVEGAEDDIQDSLRWAGIQVDEGPESGGDFEPYRQSERGEVYRKHADRLVSQGHAYIAFDDHDALEALRQRDNGNTRYDASTRSSMVNSLTLSADEVRSRLDSGDAHVVRLKVPDTGSVRFDDVIRGTVTFDVSEIDDQVLIKSDGMPTYHLANVVDDHLMGITHVIRGEEWLPSTPKHVLLYRFLGWQHPQMAHLPLILSPNGGKLSKRNADELGIPVSVRQYRDAGYEPEALLNFLAFLGWNPGDEREIFSLDELADAFSLDRVGSSGVKFSMDKLNWFNEQHLRRLSADELLQRAYLAINASGQSPDDERWPAIASLMQERISKASDLATESAYFFEDPTEYEEAGVKKRWKDDSATLLDAYASRLETAKRFDASTAEEQLRAVAEANGAGAGRIIHPVRLAISGVTFGPGLFDMMEVIGRDACVRRIRRAVTTLGS